MSPCLRGETPDADPACDALVQLAIALACHAVSDGSSCVNLRALCDEGAVVDRDGRAIAGLRWPDWSEWRVALASSPLVTSADAALAEARPLVLDDADRLYLQRYWVYENAVAATLADRAARRSEQDDVWLGATLQRLFGANDGKLDWQKTAAAVAAIQAFSVITGGPGTGKTSTVVKLLALLVEAELQAGRSAPRIALMAPTGKAAARLAESVQKARDGLACDDVVRAAIPVEAATLHRRLGLGATRRVGAPEPSRLLVDIAVVDEASMVDLRLLQRLLQALPAEARLILIGDEDQLASVDVGTILGDICFGAEQGYAAPIAERLGRLADIEAPRRPNEAAAGISDNIVRLRHSFRFAPESGIRRISDAIRAGDADTVLQLLAKGAASEVRWVSDEPHEALMSRLVEHAEAVARATTASDKLVALSGFQVLCAHREGSRGVAGINQQIELRLQELQLLGDAEGDYDGRPILIERNDYDVGLYNGDIGILTQDGESPRKVAAFARADGVRLVAPALLPEHSTVYAMTVHKSQGSEFDEVAVVLPEEPSRLLSRELLYTAVTRARQRVTLYANAEVLSAAIRQPVRRASGLHDLLWRPSQH